MAAAAIVFALLRPAPTAGQAAGRSSIPTSIDTLAADSLAAAQFARDSVGSFTVGIVAGDHLVWTRSYGYADMAAHRRATRRTVYRIASVTKPFTAVMLLQLVEAGKVQLSDPVERYLPEIRQVQGLPPGSAPVTFLQLATMTGGMPAEPQRGGPFWTGPVSDWERLLVSALPHTSYDHLPGTRFLYSSMSYAILGAALSQVAGEPYVDWEQKHILTPLGLDHTRFELDTAMAAELAHGYTVSRNGTVSDTLAANDLRAGPGYKVPSAAMFSTVDDLARFLAFEFGHGAESVLSHAQLDSVFAGVVATNPGMHLGYGIGFMTIRVGDFVWTGHSGAGTGYTAAMYFDRPSQLGVIALRNADGGKATTNVAATILERLVRGPPTGQPRPVPPRE